MGSQLQTLIQFIFAYVSGVVTVILSRDSIGGADVRSLWALGAPASSVPAPETLLAKSRPLDANVSNASRAATEDASPEAAISPHLKGAHTRIRHPGPHGLKFIHISKTGGTSIEELGNKLPEKLGWGAYDRKFYGYQHNRFRSFPAEKRRLYDWFLVVRNPIDRFVSEYHCGFEGVNYMQARFHTNKDFNDWLQVRLRQGQTPGGHFIPQSDYLDPDPEVTQHIIKFENMDADLRHVLSLYNISYPEKKLAKRNNGQKRFFSRKNITEETMGYIRFYYSGDFLNFGYPMP